MEVQDLIMEIQKYMARVGFDDSDTTVEELLVSMTIENNKLKNIDAKESSSRS